MKKTITASEQGEPLAFETDKSLHSQQTVSPILITSATFVDAHLVTDEWLQAKETKALGDYFEITPFLDFLHSYDIARLIVSRQILSDLVREDEAAQRTIAQSTVLKTFALETCVRHSKGLGILEFSLYGGFEVSDDDGIKTVTAVMLTRRPKTLVVAVPGEEFDIPEHFSKGANVPAAKATAFTIGHPILGT